MSYPGWQVRDKLAPVFRFRILDALGIVPFRHQAQIFAYLDRKELAAEPTCDVDDIWQPERPRLRADIDGRRHWLIACPRFTEVEIEKFGGTVRELVPLYHDNGRYVTDYTGDPVIDYRYFEVLPTERPRPQAVVLSGAFKCGKSEMGGIIPASFAITPDLLWDFWGYEYDLAEPEFEYLREALLSERGLNLPKHDADTGDELIGWRRTKCDPKLGRMYLDLSNGARFTCRSLKQTIESQGDPMKGKERDGFSCCEAYQYPSLQLILGYRQNLAARNGYYIIPSTPDRPIMDEINARADPLNLDSANWIGIREIPRRENPYAFKLDDYIEDLHTFTEQEITVYWEGKTGKWIGAVYPPARFFDTETHPEMWRDPEGDAVFENFDPPGWLKRVGGGDTATYYSLTSALSDDGGNIFFIHSACNYRYVSGQLEKLPEVMIENVCQETRALRKHVGGKWPGTWVDHNSQWLDEFRRNGILLTRSPKRDPEQRTEALRGLAQNGFVWFAPWLKESVLVYEYEAAKYPPKDKVAGPKRRIDANDHSLDGAEHIAAMHPKAARPRPQRPEDPVRALLTQRRRMPNIYAGDPQVGA